MCPEPVINEVLTRARTQKEEKELKTDQDTGKWLSEDHYREDEQDNFPHWEDDMFMPDRGVKRYLTCNEKKQQCQQCVTLGSAQHPLDGGATTLTQSQKDNVSLADIRESVKDSISKFLMENGLLFRQKCHMVNEDPTKQLVLRKSYQDMALQTTHMIPMAGYSVGRRSKADYYSVSSGQAYTPTWQNCANHVWSAGGQLNTKKK